MRTGSITLSIDSRLDDVFLVGLAVSRICEGAELGPAETYNAELCVVEAVNNCIEHAYEGAPGHRVDVVVTLAEDRLILTVRDTGRPMDWETAQRQATMPPSETELSEGGRGLYIIQTLMDEVAYRRDGDTNVLTLTKWLRPERPG